MIDALPPRRALAAALLLACAAAGFAFAARVPGAQQERSPGPLLHRPEAPIPSAPPIAAGERVEPPAGWEATLSARGSYWVAWRPLVEEVPLNEDFDLELVVLDGATRSHLPANVELTLDARMPAHAHGMKHEVALERGESGVWRARGMLLHMAGHWELQVDLSRGALTERAQFDIEL